MVVERNKNPCIRPLGPLVLSLWCKTTSVFLRSARYLRLGEHLTSHAKHLECVLASSPENVLFVLGIGVEWDERSLSMPSFPLKLRSLSHPRLPLGTCSYMLTYLNRPRQEGGVFARTAHSVFAFIARRHGCERRIRTVSPAYEAGMLPFAPPSRYQLCTHKWSEPNSTPQI